MSGVFRVGIRFLNRAAPVKCILEPRTCSPMFIPACNISGKTLRGSNLSRPKPFPYLEKEYTAFQACKDVLFKTTTSRFDENTKVVVVDGPIAAGKSAFAKELATELEMKYFPESNMDSYYLNRYGYDMRQLDPQLPPNMRSFDTNNFLQDPTNRNVATFQIRMMVLRYSQYIDALAHLFSTGEGVVLDRCVYSDFVFLEAMYKSGFISKAARSVYYDLVKNTFAELMKPHLVIYLDVPVQVVKDRIKKRAHPAEVNTKVLTDQYLKDMEQIYKQQYLKDISNHAELLVYDWSDYGETEVVVEDIERIDFDRFDKDDTHMRDWRMENEEEWTEARARYMNKPDLLNFFNVPRYDVPELVVSPEDFKDWYDVWFEAPGMKFRKGYNVECGDTGILTKTKLTF
ncbi:NADH dehydrogenase [ubiquinone] 1 alpha subcomplex subunit 10, mitochondrial [Topomyia yanbarensis]|uniref:NADH dehydrogenase [ubiquinone] 1 alpha subcomplex subunit 10, mitochondrial n=1 Tax=Topomyia yanbarensis TaxID=2498891 RepID=UPI00273CD34E|nr:NADH dehydrogenase [ubiquinone] 1 alpha subcomplex subunit 10, mitochondrial [Topomyia yanbarensis]XP_058831199.1 NADH dehydrogenase [ubiquinone] 1 alpha subcomplex subunit 10, mitochondrial [Topomyia yanbarensis]